MAVKKPFDAVFQADDLRITRTPPQAPRANAICERLVGTLRREFLDRTLIFGERYLSKILTKYRAEATLMSNASTKSCPTMRNAARFRRNRRRTGY